ncbi:uncharacterized protein [Argopecten irradians]|uniref:uncharacterized protein isoform X2 n=1 Tax=Argopecten irradians TaxID=31199 RepID=UPI0037155574
MAPRKIAFLQIYLYMFFVHQTRSEENLSLGKSAVQSNSYSAHYASKAVDGCFKQTIESGCCSHTAPDQKQAWWQVDLGSRATISYITIYYRDERKSQRFAGYQLYLSNITDYRNGVLCYEDTSNSLTEVELVITHQCPYTAQYVTIYNYRNNPRRHDWYSVDAFLELCEVQVYGCPRRTYGYGDCNEICSDNCYLHNCHATNGSCFKNLSFGKSAVQSNSFSKHTAAVKAVDGCFKQKHESGCCSHTAESQNKVWWQVDLGSRATVSYITIYYRDNFRFRFAGYQLYLSNITDFRNGVLCYEDTSNNLTKVELVITHQCPYTAQYVTIYNYRNNPRRHDWYSTYAYLELCEVQVYGCPRQTYGYGDCNGVCSDNCYLSNCHATNGSCFNTKEQQQNMTVVVVLAVIAAFCLVAAIVSFVVMLRLRSNLKKEQEKDGHYEAIDMGRSNPQEIYESTAPKI